MPELNCESVCIAAMAMADGYRPDMSSDQVEVHLVSCASCRHEVGQLRKLAGLLDMQERKQQNEYIWTAIEGRLPAAPLDRHASPTWHPFMFMGSFLFVFKLVEMIPDRDFGLLFKLVPILLIIATFGYLRVNPFKINAELRLDGGE